MLISHKESSKAQTNSILNSYYKDTKLDYENVTDTNDRLVEYQAKVAKSISLINTAIANYYKAAKYLYMLEKRVADALSISLDWSKVGFANTYQEVIDYDISQ